MRHLKSTDYQTTPWKNGGGTTTQLLVAPEGASPADPFLFRMSVAVVASDGPFSAFPGYARHLVVVSGEGMRLVLHGAEELHLRPFLPVTFSGDAPAHGVLLDGPVRDLNLIVDRARATGSLACMDVSAPLLIPCAASETCIVHVIDGALDLADAGDTLVLEEPCLLSPRGGGPVRVVVGRVAQPLPSSGSSGSAVTLSGIPNSRA